MPGTRGAAQGFGDPLGIDKGRVAGRIHICDRGGEDDIGAGLFGHRRVAAQIARVGVVILAGAELGRVDENREHEQIAARAPGAQQRQVSFVEKAHGRHEGDPLAFAMRLPAESLHPLDVGDDGHKIEGARFEVRDKSE